MKLCVEIDYVKKEFYFRIVKVYIIKRGALELIVLRISVQYALKHKKCSFKIIPVLIACPFSLLQMSPQPTN